MKNLIIRNLVLMKYSLAEDSDLPKQIFDQLCADKSVDLTAKTLVIFMLIFLENF